MPGSVPGSVTNVIRSYAKVTSGFLPLHDLASRE